MDNVYVLYGEDDFSLKEALGKLKERLGPSDMRELNTTVVKGADFTLEHLQQLCATIPFLAPARMVMVEGLLSAFEQRGPRRRRSQRSKELGPWAALPGYLPQVPPTTLLVFLEGPLRDNPLLASLQAVAQVRRFPLLRGEALGRWIRERVHDKGGQIAPRAVLLMMEMMGGNLWAVDSELAKLSLFVGDRPIQDSDVQLLTTHAREATIFAAIDAMLEGRPAAAIRLVHRLLEGGATVPYVLTMLARQVRLLILARELVGQKVDQKDMGGRLGLSAPFAVRKTLEQAQAYSTGRLEALHRRLLEADTAIKTGAMEGGVVMDALVTEVSHWARR